MAGGDDLLEWDSGAALLFWAWMYVHIYVHQGMHGTLGCVQSRT